MNKSGFDSERRRFISQGLFAATTLLLFPVVKFRGAPWAAQAADLKPLSQKDATAMAMGYFEDANKTDIKKFPKRAAADGKTQFCDNCQFSQPLEGKWLKCQIFPNNKVAAKAWCNTWMKKA